MWCMDTLPYCTRPSWRSRMRSGGEVPCVFIELKAGVPAPSEPEIIAFCRERLAHFKCPRRVIFCSLPKTATGKIQKFRLRQEAGSTTAITGLARHD